MISPYVYWKSATVSLDIAAPAARQRLAETLAASGFTAVGAMNGRELIFTRPARLPRLPHLQVWTATVDGHGKHARIRIEFGLRATPGTWLTFAATVLLCVAPVFVPGYEMAAMVPLLWLFACVLWMQWRPARQEAHLWQTMGANILDHSSAWRAVE